MTRFSDIPDVEHYAIIQSETVHIPGDERSRTNPGHGYPAEDVETISYRVFMRHQRKEWEAEIEKMTNRPFVKFKALHVRPAEITTKTIISVKVD